MVNQAVQACEAAALDWAETPPVERARILFRYKMLLEDHFEELAASVTREHGKTLTEARGDVRRGVEVVEYACGAPELLKGEALENIARGIDCDVIKQPVGLRRHLPLQLPRAGADVDVSAGPGLRQHLHPEAEREGPADRPQAD
jgi:acyl-CoA reductase-like NAD-dependent aldehyde dehydrogenase